MVLLVSLVPLYIFIPEFISHREMNVPELTLDRLIPLKPSWALVYGSLYMFLIVLPVLALRDEVHIRRTVSAYLLVWIAAYICFLTYPTVAPRPTQVSGVGFGVWGLRALYSADPPYNCFPSLHVAHSFVSALTCYRLHRAVGTAAVTAASLVALSTLYTKQHYVLDVAAGVFLAFVAYAIFLRSYPRHRVSELDHQAAPLLALGLLTALGVAVAALWLVHQRG
jgi:membrane-associated phospholipid phosphatase